MVADIQLPREYRFLIAETIVIPHWCIRDESQPDRQSGLVMTMAKARAAAKRISRSWAGTSVAVFVPAKRGAAACHKVYLATIRSGRRLQHRLFTRRMAERVADRHLQVVGVVDQR